MVKNGNTYYHVEITNPVGNWKLFYSYNTISKLFAVLIRGHKDIKFSMTANHTTVDGITMGNAPWEQPGHDYFKDGFWRVTILNAGVSPYAEIPGWFMSDHIHHAADPTLVAVHEFGHLIFDIGWSVHGPSDWSAVYFENQYRKLTNPSGPTRIRHNWEDNPAKPRTWGINY
jgi:hypothetical protein